MIIHVEVTRNIGLNMRFIMKHCRGIRGCVPKNTWQQTLRRRSGWIGHFLLLGDPAQHEKFPWSCPLDRTWTAPQDGESRNDQNQKYCVSYKQCSLEGPNPHGSVPLSALWILQKTEWHRARLSAQKEYTQGGYIEHYQMKPQKTQQLRDITNLVSHWRN